MSRSDLINILLPSLQLRRFDVVGLHKGTVTALAWSANGMKLFSGDDKGKVVFSAVDLDQVTFQLHYVANCFGLFPNLINATSHSELPQRMEHVGQE